MQQLCSGLRGLKYALKTLKNNLPALYKFKFIK